MKVIDLLVKIANGEEVPMFKYEGHRYKYNKENHWFEDSDRNDYIKDVFVVVELNDEVEIIEDTPKEDKKIEKLNLDKDKLKGKEIPRAIDYLLEGKLNEIIDTLKENKKIEKIKAIKDNDGNYFLLNYENKKYIISVVDAIMLDKINEIIDKINGE